MKKILSLFLILSILVSQNIFAVASSNETNHVLQENEFCGEPSLIEELHHTLIQNKTMEMQQFLFSETNQASTIIPTLSRVLMPSTGDIKMLVLPISFRNYLQLENKFNKEEWIARFFAPFDSDLELWEQSVRGYFYQQSYGKLDITGTVLPVYQAPLYSSAYENNRDLKAQLIEDALAYYCEQGLDISQFDNDHDGIIDALVVQHLRPVSSPESTGALDSLWGKQEINGYSIYNFIQIIQGTLISSHQVYEHEIGHLLGLLDNYEFGTTGNNNIIDYRIYELMCSSGNGYINVYYKYLLGWIEPVILTGENPVQTIELSPVELQPDGVGPPPKALVLIPNAAAFPFTEYFIIEYRKGSIIKSQKNPWGLIYDVVPGIIIWHCNTALNDYLQYKNRTNYIKPVYKSGKDSFAEKDMYIAGNEFSSASTPNSNFYNDVYTGAYLKVEEITENKAVLQAGFRDPDLSPAPVIEVSAPSKLVIRKGETATVVVTVKVGDQLLPLDSSPSPLFNLSSTGTVSSAGSMGSALKNPYTITIPGYMYHLAPELGDGTIWVDIPAGAIRYNNKDSNAATSEKIYIDNTPPEITLKGDDPQRVYQGITYVDPGAIATDNLDPDIESKLQVDTSQVDTSTLGSYTVTYSLTDHAGHTTTAERTVIVEEVPSSHEHSFSIEWSRDGTTHWHECGCGEKSEVAAHAEVTDPAVEATCTTLGKTEGSHCSVCGYVIVPQTDVPMVEHSYPSTWNHDASSHWKECTTCHNKNNVDSHTEDSGTITKRPTEEETGLKIYACSVCGYEMRTETLDKLEPTHKHSFSAEWSSDETNHWHECECGEKSAVSTHTAVIDPAVEATCTTLGKTEGSHCSVCGYVIVPQTDIPMVEHSYPNTWSHDASSHWKECTACHERSAQASHAWDKGVVTTAPTSSKPGIRTYTCTVCGRTRTENIPATGGGSQGGNSGSWSPSPATYAISLPKDIANGKVTVSAKEASKGDQITVTLIPEEGYQVEALTVTDSRKNKVPLTEQKDGQYTFTMPGSKVEIAVTFRAVEKKQEPVPVQLPFTDVSPKSWYYEAVCSVYEKGLMKGTTQTLFSPDQPVSRGMLVTMLYRLEGQPAVTVSTEFSDVSPRRYYAPAVAWAAEKGIVLGYTDGTFRPNGDISRQDMALILYRYGQYKGYDVLKQEPLSVYTDYKNVRSYALNAMQWAHSNNIISGRNNQILDPCGYTSRAEAATVLFRFFTSFEL